MRSAQHQSTAVLSCFLMIIGPVTLPGCGGGPPEIAPEPSRLTLSAQTIVPGRFLTIQHPDIKVGSPVQVRFTGANGFTCTFEAQNTQDGQVRVPVPPLIDMQSGQLAPGNAIVSIVGLPDEASLSIEDLPGAQGAAPGLVLRAVFAAALDDHISLLDKIAAVSAHTNGGAETSGIESATNDMIARLQAMIDEYDSTGSLTIQDGNGTSRAMTPTELELADRYLAAIFLGIADEISGGMALAASSRGAKLQPTQQDGSSQPDIVQQINNAIPAVRDGLRSGLAGGSTYMAGAGVAFAVIGLVIEAPLIAVGGAICVVGGAVCSFSNGALGGRNSDSFFNNDGDIFSSGQEAISQGIRYLSDAASVIPGVPGLIATVTSLATGIYDFFNNSRDIKCQEPQNTSNQRAIRIAARTIEDFCEATAGIADGDGNGDAVLDSDLFGWTKSIYFRYDHEDMWYSCPYTLFRTDHTFYDFSGASGVWSLSGSTITLTRTPMTIDGGCQNFVFSGTVTRSNGELHMEGTFTREHRDWTAMTTICNPAPGIWKTLRQGEPTPPLYFSPY